MIKKEEHLEFSTEAQEYLDEILETLRLLRDNGYDPQWHTDICKAAHRLAWVSWQDGRDSRGEVGVRMINDIDLGGYYKTDVGKHYDQVHASGLRELLGDHLHQGLWYPGTKDRKKAVEAMSQLVIDKMDLPQHEKLHVLDVGAGYGAVGKMIIDQYPLVSVEALTNSSAQCGYMMADSGPWSSQLLPTYGDFMGQGFGYTQEYDSVIMLEVLEHIDDVQMAIDKAFRLLRPGGTLTIASWTTKHSQWFGDPSLSVFAIDHIETAGVLLADLAEAGFVSIGYEDLSPLVKPTWDNLAKQVPAMEKLYHTVGKAYDEGLLGYGIFTARKRR